MFDDGAVDRLIGQNEMDWFFANLNGGILDRWDDPRAGEVISELSRLIS